MRGGLHQGAMSEEPTRYINMAATPHTLPHTYTDTHAHALTLRQFEIGRDRSDSVHLANTMTGAAGQNERGGAPAYRRIGASAHRRIGVSAHQRIDALVQRRIQASAQL